MIELRHMSRMIPNVTGKPSLSVKFREGFSSKRMRNGRVTLFRRGEKFLDMPDISLVESLMENWMTEIMIDRLAEAADDQPVFHLLCGKLFSLGLLQVQCRVDRQPLFSLLPAPDWHVWQEMMPSSLQRLSTNACLRRVENNFLLEMPLSQRKCILYDERCFAWLMEVVQGGAYLLATENEDEARAMFYRALWLMGALEEYNQSPTRDVWEFQDLLFFHHSSIGFHDDPIGATWHLKGKIPPAPLFKPCRGLCVLLPEPDGRLEEKLRAPFSEVLSNRRSNRVPGSQPISLEQLGGLLHTSARVQNILDDSTRPHPVSKRPSPSGGALHSLEIYLLVRQCAGLAPGPWRYDPEQHRLESIASERSRLDSYLKSNPHALIPGVGLPQISMVLTSRFLRNSWKYERIAYRLVLQDLGCLYQTISLAATALGLASCILGTVDARRLGRMLNLDPYVEPVIGEMTLSSSDVDYTT